MTDPRIMQRARELAAHGHDERYWRFRGPMSGQWDRGEVVRSHIQAAELSLIRDREEAQE